MYKKERVSESKVLKVRFALPFHFSILHHHHHQLMRTMSRSPEASFSPSALLCSISPFHLHLNETPKKRCCPPPPPPITTFQVMTSPTVLPTSPVLRRPQLLTCLLLMMMISSIVVAFLPIGASSAAVEAKLKNQLKNRLSLCIVTDADYVRRFNGNEEAAFNHTIQNFELVNRELLKKKFTIFTGRRPNRRQVTGTHFGFELRAVKLGHPAFDNLAVDGKNRVLNVSQLNSMLDSTRALDPELDAHSLVLYLTDRPLSEEYRGFKRGASCHPPTNLVVVSLHGCSAPLDDDEDDSPIRQQNFLATMLHELLHGLGVPHSADSDNDVMKAIGASNLNISDDTRLNIEFGLQEAADGGCLSAAEGTVRLVTYSRGGIDAQREKVVDYRKVAQFMLKKKEKTDKEEEKKEKEKEKKEDWKSTLKHFLLMLLIFHLYYLLLVGAVFCVVSCCWEQFSFGQFYRHLFADAVSAAAAAPAAAADDDDDDDDNETPVDGGDESEKALLFELVLSGSAQAKQSKVKKRVRIADKAGSATKGDQVAMVEQTKLQCERATTPSL